MSSQSLSIVNERRPSKSNSMKENKKHPYKNRRIPSWGDAMVVRMHGLELLKKEKNEEE